jgi:hypothetical protein
MNDPQFIIVDLDNCISDDSRRIPLINWSEPDNFRRYHPYHMEMLGDPLGNEDIVRRPENIIVFTARPEYYRPPTCVWLVKHEIFPVAIFMRGNDDHRHSDEIKDEQLDRLLQGNITLNQIVCAYDDREAVLAIYRKAGIKTERRWIHEVSAYKGDEDAKEIAAQNNVKKTGTA